MFIKLKVFIAKYFSSFAWFYGYLRNKIFIAFFLSLGVSVLDGLGLTMFIPLLQVVDESGAVGGEEMGKLEFVVQGMQSLGIPMTLIAVLIVMVVFFILKGIFLYISQVYIILLQQGFIRQIRLNLVRELNELSFKRFISSDVGRIQNTITGEVSRVSIAFMAYFTTFQNALMVAVYMTFAFFSNPKFALLVAIGGGLTNFLYRIIYTRTKNLSREFTKSSSGFQGLIIQFVAHFKYLKATGTSKKYSEKLHGKIFEIENARRKMGMLGAISKAAREPMLIMIIAGVIFIQVHFFGGSFASMVLSLMFFYRGLTSLISVQETWNNFMTVHGSLENMQDFHKEMARGKEKPATEELKSFDKGIRLEEVGFAYGDTPILNHINLEIKKNESVAFVGESGSGKTTLVNLVAGLLPESQGSIYVDENELKILNKQSYQRRIGYVSQDPVTFNDTIYNNITFWAPKTPENLARFEMAVQQAALKEFLDDLPQGEETELGNNGINLSGGQKQRVSIARELYKDIDILILDEATSALDSETEKAIQASIDALQGQYTILSVAHRLSTIKNADKIVFMDQGQILDIDSFDNLVQKQERFKKMVELQEL